MAPTGSQAAHFAAGGVRGNPVQIAARADYRSSCRAITSRWIWLVPS